MKKLDIALLILFPLTAVTVSLAFQVNFFVSILLFYGLPSFWLSLRTPKRITKTFFFALIFSLPIGIFIDYLATPDQSWFIPHSIFHFRLWGFVPIDNLVWGFFLVYFVIIFYEHFLEKGRDKQAFKKANYFVWCLMAVLALFVGVTLVRPEILVLHYAYFWIGIVLVLLPFLSFISFFPKLLAKFVRAGSYFFVLSLVYELTALQLNWWSFPGTHFIGWVQLLGYRFPFEEFFFYMSLITTALLSYYEFFDDDRK